MIFSASVAGVDGRGWEGQKLFRWPRQTVCCSVLPELCGSTTHKHAQQALPLRTLVSLPQDSPVARGTYKALCGIIHEAQLEALLVLKGLCQGVTQVVRGQGALPTLLELGENALKTRARTCLHTDNGMFTKALVSHRWVHTPDMRPDESHVHGDKQEVYDYISVLPRIKYAAYLQRTKDAWLSQTEVSR